MKAKTPRFNAIVLAAGLSIAPAAPAIDLDPMTGGSRVPLVGHARAATGYGSVFGGMSAASVMDTAALPGGQRLFEAIDRDGFVTRAEARGSDEVSRRFDALDADRNGKLSAEELGATGVLSP